MTGPTRLAALGAATLAALALAAPAAMASHYPPGGPPEYEQFWASATGTQVTTYKGPKQSGGDCFYHWESQAGSTEKVKFHAKPRKVLAVRRGIVVFFQYGTWNANSLRPAYFPATGSTTRVDQSTFTQSGGPCGTKSDPPPPPAKRKCGTKKRYWDLSLAYSATDQTLGLGVQQLISSIYPGAGPFDDTCQIIATPPGADADTISKVAVSFPANDIFGGFGKQIILGHKEFVAPGQQLKTTVDWTLTLVRHGKPHRF